MHILKDITVHTLGGPPCIIKSHEMLLNSIKCKREEAQSFDRNEIERLSSRERREWRVFNVESNLRVLVSCAIFSKLPSR